MLLVVGTIVWTIVLAFVDVDTGTAEDTLPVGVVWLVEQLFVLLMDVETVARVIKVEDVTGIVFALELDAPVWWVFVLFVDLVELVDEEYPVGVEGALLLLLEELLALVEDKVVHLVVVIGMDDEVVVLELLLEGLMTVDVAVEVLLEEVVADDDEVLLVEVAVELGVLLEEVEVDVILLKDVVVVLLEEVVVVLFEEVVEVLGQESCKPVEIEQILS